jgi:magnesium-transporting ATPase (P-type)
VVDRSLLLRAFLWLGGIEAALCYLGFFAVYYLAGYTDLLHLPRFDWLPYSQRLATPDSRVYLVATTIFHAGVVMAQIGNAFTCRTEKEAVHHLGWFSNRFLLVGVAVELALILVLIYFRPLAVLFEHVPLPGMYWLVLGLYAPVLYLFDRTRKIIARHSTRDRQHRQPLARQEGAST